MVRDAPELERSTLDRGDATLWVLHSRREVGGTPILFVHGYPDTHATWSYQLAELAAEHPVATFDLRGVGGSQIVGDAEAATRMERHLGDIEAVIDHVAGPEGQVHLVAHDWGGALAWMFAGDPARARRLRSLTVIAAPNGGAALAMFRDRLRRRSLADLAKIAEQIRRSWYLLLFQLPWLPERYLSRDPARTWVGAHRRGGLGRSDPELGDVDPAEARRSLLGLLPLYRQMFSRETRRRAQSSAQKITVPVCMVIPLRDMALTPELYERLPEFVEQLEQHRIDDNHWVHRSSAAEVNQILRSFVARHG